METNKSAFLDVVVFARSTVLGQVKRRLADSLGRRRALAIHRKLLRHSLRAVAAAHQTDPSLRPVLFHLGPAPAADLPSSFDGLLVPQPHQEMAANLADAVRSPASGHRLGVVVIGADHPLLGRDQIIAMARLLDRYPVAVGPAEDGGFWALATRVPLDSIAIRIPLGTDQALARLLDGIAEAGLACGIGPTLWDVDNPSDVDRWKREIAEPRLR